MLLTGKGLTEFVKSKLGTPYVYGAKLNYGKFTQSQLNNLSVAYPNIFTPNYINKANKYVGKECTDCSGLISGYTNKVIGSYQLRQTASKRYPISNILNMPIGTVLWKSGHVGIYVGTENGIPMCIEAKGINYGTIKSKVSNTKWRECLVYDYIGYDMISVDKKSNQNKYSEPVGVILRRGSKNNYVKWVQYELNEAGFNLSIDGIFGPETEKSVKKFQQSCKIVVDGIVGKNTIKCLNEKLNSTTQKEYVVKSGDTLYTIAKAHNTTINAIALANNIKNINLINVEQKLLIPAISTSNVINTESKKTLKVGSVIKIKQGAKDIWTNKCFSSFVYTKKYNVIKIKGKNVTFGINKQPTGTTSIENIIIL